MIDWLKDLLVRLGTAIGAFIAGFVAGKLKEQNKELKNDLNDAKDRASIEDRNLKLSPLERRRMLNKWMQRVPTDKTDGT